MDRSDRSDKPERCEEVQLMLEAAKLRGEICSEAMLALSGL